MARSAAPTEPTPASLAPAPETGAGDEQGGARLRSTIQTIGSVVAPTTLVTALLYYFGWARATATYDHFGIDQSTLGFSTQDYLLHSTNSAFRPLSLVLLLGLLAGWLQLRLARTLESGTPAWLLPLVAHGARVVGLLLLLIGLLGRYGPLVYNVAFPVVPLSLATGVLLLTYGSWVRRRWQPARDVARDPRLSPPWLTGLRRGLLWAFVIVNLFAAVAGYADERGRELGRQLEANLQIRPGVILYSVQPLGLDGPGVDHTGLPAGPSRFRFRYTGLKLLVRSGGKYFLVPAGWSSGSGASTFAIPDGDDIRVEFQPGSNA
jgi:hypothetical protein